MICHVWFVTFVSSERYSGGSEFLIIGEQLAAGQSDGGISEKRRPSTAQALIDSSTPIIVIETVEEVRAVRMMLAACSALNLG
jgi:hypothetical protein